MYSLELSDLIKKIILKQNPKNQKLLRSKLNALEQDNFSGDKALKGDLGPFRIIYIKEHLKLVIIVIHIGYKKVIYE